MTGLDDATSCFVDDADIKLGAHKRCERCGTNLTTLLFIQRLMWIEADIASMAVGHTRGRCDVIASGGDPDYRPPVTPRAPACESRITRDGRAGWIDTHTCTRERGHEDGVHTNGMATWLDEDADPAGMRPEDVAARHRSKDRFEELDYLDFGLFRKKRWDE